MNIDDNLPPGADNDKDKIKQLIKLYERVIHGDKNTSGLFSCYDTYYKGCWDKDLEEIAKLKKEIDKHSK